MRMLSRHTLVHLMRNFCLFIAKTKIPLDCSAPLVWLLEFLNWDFSAFCNSMFRCNKVCYYRCISDLYIVALQRAELHRVFLVVRRAKACNKHPLALDVFCYHTSHNAGICTRISNLFPFSSFKIVYATMLWTESRRLFHRRIFCFYYFTDRIPSLTSFIKRKISLSLKSEVLLIIIAAIPLQKIPIFI